MFEPINTNTDFRFRYCFQLILKAYIQIWRI